MLLDAHKRVRSAASSLAYETDPEKYAEKETQYDTATRQLERMELRTARDKHAMMPEETLELAKKSGLISGFSKEDRKFIDGIKKLFDANGGASTFQEELTETLNNAAMKHGTLDAKQIIGILEKAQADDVSMREELEKRYNAKAGKVDYDEEIPLPQIQKLMDKSGIKSNER